MEMEENMRRYMVMEKRKKKDTCVYSRTCFSNMNVHMNHPGVFLKCRL